MKESFIFNFLSVNFLSCKIGYQREKQSVTGPVIK